MEEVKAGNAAAGVQGEERTPRETAALIVVDVQEGFCEPNGALAVKGGRALAPVWNDLLASDKFVCKVATHDWHPADHISFASQHPGAQPFTSQHTIENPENPDEVFTTTLWPDHCVSDTHGARLIPELEQQHLTHLIFKGQDKRVECYSAFGPPFKRPAMVASKLNDILKEKAVTDVWVVGLAYDFCVKHTALDAAELGYRTYVLEGATKAVDPSERSVQMVREELSRAGVVVVEGVEVA